jgi:group I intron endonuclease
MLIYKITNRVNGKVYIGKTNTTIAKRWRKHLNEAKWHDLRHLYAAINKYGKENFSVETVEMCDESEGGEKNIGLSITIPQTNRLGTTSPREEKMEFGRRNINDV